MSAATDTAYAIIARQSKSFAFASKLLDPHARAAAAIVYAWCRRVDDAVDLAPDPAHAVAALERERTLLDAVHGDGPLADPLLAALRDVFRQHQVPRRYPSELLAGMEMDVRGTRYETVDDLLLYCFRVAGTVGLIMAHIMGVSDARALRNASHLGIAMQLTNICRDVREDWERGRLYLPTSLVGGPPRTGQFAAEVIRGAVQRLLALADLYYASGDRGLGALPWRSSLAIRTARLVYWGIGQVIARRDYDVLRGRAYVTWFGKVRLLARAVVDAVRDLRGRRGVFQPVMLPAEVKIDDCIRL